MGVSPMVFLKFMDPLPDIVLPYKSKRSATKRWLQSLFFGGIAVVAVIVAGLQYRFNLSTHNAVQADWTIFCAAAFVTVLLVPVTILQIYYSVWYPRSSGRILLSETSITFPAGFSLRDMNLRYADIIRMRKKTVDLPGRFGRVSQSFTILQLFYATGKKGITLQVLESPRDAEILLQTLEEKTGLLCENPLRPPSLPGIRNNFLP
jgi:hypothetical protein